MMSSNPFSPSLKTAFIPPSESWNSQFVTLSTSVSGRMYKGEYPEARVIILLSHANHGDCRLVAHNSCAFCAGVHVALGFVPIATRVLLQFDVWVNLSPAQYVLVGGVHEFSSTIHFIHSGFVVLVPVFI